MILAAACLAYSTIGFSLFPNNRVTPNQSPKEWVVRSAAIRQAISTSSLPQLINNYQVTVKQDRSRPDLWFALSTAIFYANRMIFAKLLPYQKTIPSYFEAEIPMMQSVRRDPRAGYPIAGMYRQVSYFRETGMLEPNRELIRTVKVKDSLGNLLDAPVYRVVSDPPKEQRLYELLVQMIKNDPEDPLVLYCRGHAEKDPAKAIELLKRSIELVPNALYEFDAYRLILRKAQKIEDKVTEKWVLERVEEARKSAPVDLVKLAGF